MPKATISFDLPSEQIEYEVANKAPKYLYALCEYDIWLRNQLKHVPHPENVANALASARDKLYSILNEEGIQIHD